MPDPLVSIAIPVFNRERLLDRALESSIAQTYSSVEVVVSDNCSRDRSYEVAASWARRDSRVRVIRNERNLGPVENWRRCVNECRGGYLKILYSDDWLEPSAVAKLLRPLLTSDALGFTYSKAQLETADGRALTLYDAAPEGAIDGEEFLWQHLLGNVPVSPSAFLFRRDDFLRVFPAELPVPSSLPCRDYGIGFDAVPAWRLCLERPFVVRTADAVVHFGESTRGERSFTLDLQHSGRSSLLEDCYLAALLHVLGEVAPSRSRSLVNAGLLLTRWVFQPANTRRSLASLKALAPPGYRFWRVRLADQRVLRLLAAGLRRRSRQREVT
ncbi:MAG: glycosyltransferase family 2 protein [Acidobacteriota bacterium]